MLGRATVVPQVPRSRTDQTLDLIELAGSMKQKYINPDPKRGARSESPESPRPLGRPARLGRLP
jgi:hypothetical protein